MVTSDPKVTKALGKIAYRRGDFRDAARLLADASIDIKNDADLLYHLGISQHRLNERRAKDSLTRALQLDAGSKLAADAKKALAEMQ
jgi:Flp pilus assembly protein TadD